MYFCVLKGRIPVLHEPPILTFSSFSSSSSSSFSSSCLISSSRSNALFSFSFVLIVEPKIFILLSCAVCAGHRRQGDDSTHVNLPTPLYEAAATRPRWTQADEDISACICTLCARPRSTWTRCERGNINVIIIAVEAEVSALGVSAGGGGGVGAGL